jgi:hypothetical protein
MVFTPDTALHLLVGRLKSTECVVEQTQQKTLKNDFSVE